MHTHTHTHTQDRAPPTPHEVFPGSLFRAEVHPDRGPPRPARPSAETVEGAEGLLLHEAEMMRLQAASSCSPVMDDFLITSTLCYRIKTTPILNSCLG